MTVREFMLKKFPPRKWFDCPVPKHHWETIQEYANKYHESEVKKLNLFNSSQQRDKLIENMLKDMGDRNNTIDLDAYARGLIDMYDRLKNTIHKSKLNKLKK